MYQFYEEISRLHLLVNGNIDDAINDLNEALNVDLRNANLYYERGLLYKQKKIMPTLIRIFQTP